MVLCITHKALPFSHGFFTRQGGVSHGLFESLNCEAKEGEDIANVIENRRRVLEYFRSHYLLITAKQRHTAKPFFVDDVNTVVPDGVDALITKTKGVLLGVLTADCCPILVADRYAKIVGAIHAGWLGASAGIIENSLELMIKMGAKRENIIAVTGPCLGIEHFEIREDFIKKIVPLTPFDISPYLQQRGRSINFNLLAYVNKRLSLSGIIDIHTSYQDTYSNPHLFFSYRRKTHHGEPYFGNQISVIGLSL